MADINEVNGVFGGVEYDTTNGETNFGGVQGQYNGQNAGQYGTTYNGQNAGQYGMPYNGQNPGQYGAQCNAQAAVGVQYDGTILGQFGKGYNFQNGEQYNNQNNEPYGYTFGGVQYDGQLLGNTNNNVQNVENYSKTLPAKRTAWTKFKAFWLQEIKVELTPHQQKIENEINEFLHQEITWEKVHDFLFQEITFGKNKKK